MQHDLFPSRTRPLELTTAPGRTEPRLWVRRLLIWRDVGDLVREVPLKPGLNIVWSPDAGDAEEAIGHGSGKTTFCRLLRYCLGENSFAPSEQRRATLRAMPNGRVGAEVRLDGQDWAVLRSFAPTNGDWALPGRTLDEASDYGPPTGMEPFRQAATDAILSAAMPLMPALSGGASAWSAVLAWLTRDQECRFAHLLDWRHADSDSNSPVRGLSFDERLQIVRAVLGALTDEELGAAREREVQTRRAAALRRDIERLDWQSVRWRQDLAAQLNFQQEHAPSDLDAAAFTSAATERLAAAVGSGKQVDLKALESAEAEQDRLIAEERAAALALERRTVEIQERDRYLKQLRDELPQLSAAAATVPLCSICRQPIGDVHQCDATEHAAELSRKREEHRAADSDLASLRATESSLRHSLAAAAQKRNQHRAALDRMRRAAVARATDVRRAQQLVADADRYGRILAERQTSADQLTHAEAEDKRLTTTLEEHRAAVNDLIRRLGERCNAIAQELIPGEVTARIVLEAKNLRLHINKGGDNTATAIESQKVVIFDLAVLALSLEGVAALPGFLVHDSPREADLGISIYHRLFAFAQRLERHGQSPLFQYVITTTTMPPQNLVDEGRVMLHLRGAPASERLFRTDL